MNVTTACLLILLSIIRARVGLKWEVRMGEGKTFDKSQKMQMTVIFKNSSVNKGETKECFHFSLEHVSFRISFFFPFLELKNLGSKSPVVRTAMDI